MEKVEMVEKLAEKCSVQRLCPPRFMAWHPYHPPEAFLVRPDPRAYRAVNTHRLLRAGG